MKPCCRPSALFEDVCAVAALFCKPMAKCGDGRAVNLVAYFNQIMLHFADGEEAFTAFRPAADLRFFSFALFNEFKDRLLNALDGIADAAPESANIK